MAVLPATWDMYDLIQGFIQAPAYHLVFEALLIVWIFKLIFSKSYAPERTVLTEKEKSDLIADWQPEPLAPHVPDDHPVLQSMEHNMISGRPDKYVNINGKRCINMATLDFLGMINDKSIEKEAIAALKVYGVGSCGPRGFYGTMDVHLELEDKLAKFMNCEEAILYSYGFATIASAIPAYSKRGDIVFCDEGVCFSIQKGLVASRSIVKFFKHNDTDDLERLLIEQEKNDKKNPKKAKATRRFIVTEGLSINYGDICPLPKLDAYPISCGGYPYDQTRYTGYDYLLQDKNDYKGGSHDQSGDKLHASQELPKLSRPDGVAGVCSVELFIEAENFVTLELKWKYKVRIFLEESLSFGVLGKTGRGVTEYFNVNIDEIDLIAASLENSIASIGGFCCGRKYVIDHQRLSGLGYCFSASLPPMLASAATQAISILDNNPGLLIQLEENSKLMHKGLSKLEGFCVLGDPIAPIKHVRLSEPSDDRDLDMKTLQMIVDHSMKQGVALTLARYLEKEEHILPCPSIRVSVNCRLDKAEIDRVLSVVTASVNKVMSASS